MRLSSPGLAVQTSVSTYMSSSTGHKVRLQVKHDKIYTYLLPLSLALFYIKFLAGILWLFTQLTYHNLEDCVLEHVVKGNS